MREENSLVLVFVIFFIQQGAWWFQACPIVRLSVAGPKPHAVALQLISQCPDCLFIVDIYKLQALPLHLSEIVAEPFVI